MTFKTCTFTKTKNLESDLVVDSGEKSLIGALQDGSQVDENQGDPPAAASASGALHRHPGAEEDCGTKTPSAHLHGWVCRIP